MLLAEYISFHSVMVEVRAKALWQVRKVLAYEVYTDVAHAYYGHCLEPANTEETG